jgi:hypothetical protein
MSLFSCNFKPSLSMPCHVVNSTSVLLIMAMPKLVLLHHKQSLLVKPCH